MLSALVDGELDSDELNEVLLAALRDERQRGQLERLLELRCALAPWRKQGDGADAPSLAMTRASRHRFAGRGVLALAAVLAVTFTAWLLLPAYFRPATHSKVATVEHAADDAATITPEDAARVFDLHESMAGPLAWLAVTSGKVEMRSAPQDARDVPAVACFLRLEPRAKDAFPQAPDLVICRPDEKVVLNVPATAGQTKDMQIELVAVRRGGELGVQYAISLEARSDPGASTTFTGFLPLRGSAQAEGRLAQAGMHVEVALHASVLNEEVRG